MPKYYNVPGRGYAEFPDDMSDDEIRRYVANALREERQADVSYGPILDTAMGMLGRGSANVAKGLAKSAEGVGWDSMGQYLRELATADEDKFLGMAEMPGSKAAGVGEMLGTTGGLMATRMLPVVGQGIAGVAGAGLGAEEARDRQIAALMRGEEVTPDQQMWGQLGGAALGSLESLNLPGGFTKLGKMLRPGAQAAATLSKEAKAAQELTRLADLSKWGLAGEAGKQFVGEALEEGIEEGGQNLLESYYNQRRGLLDNVPESMLLGGLMGGAMGGAGAALAGRKARRWGYGGLGSDTGDAGPQPGTETEQMLMDQLLSPAQQQQAGAFNLPAGLGPQPAQPAALAAPAPAPSPLEQLVAEQQQQEQEKEEEPLLRPQPMPALPDALDLAQRVTGSMSQAATDMGMGRRVGGSFVENLFGADSTHTDLARAGLDITDPNMPEERSQLALRSGLQPGVVSWLRNNNWINPKEWSMLQRAAKTSGQLEDVRQANPNMPADQRELTAISRVLGDRAVGYELTPELEKIYQRSVGALKAAGTALRAEGINSLDEAMVRLRPARGPRAEPPVDPQYEADQSYLNERLKGYKPEQGLVANMVRDLRTTTGDPADARYTKARKRIEVLMQAAQPGEDVKARRGRIARLLDHEFVHYLRDAGFFTPGQWKTLVKKATKRGHVAQATERYAGQQGYTTDTFEEEGVGNLFGDTANNVAPDGFVDRMWNRITNGVERIGNAFAGRGWQTADDIFSSIRRGEVTQQTPQHILQQQQAEAAMARRQELMAGPVTTEGQARARAMSGAAGPQELYALPENKEERDYLTSVAEDVSRGDVTIPDWVESLVQERGEEFRPVAEKWAGEVKRLGASFRDVARRTMEDLDVRVPDEMRVASGDPTRTIAGQRFSELDLARPSEGFLPMRNMGEEQANKEVQRIWEESIQESEGGGGTVAREAVGRTRMRPPNAKFWDKSFSLPQRARFWYELSGEGFTGDYTDLPEDMQKRLIDAVAGTSGGVEPYPNLKRAIGILSEDMQKQPIMTDLRDPVSARKALSPEEIQTLKYGSFSGTMQYTSGLTDKAPLSTNDVQVASMFGIDQNSFRKSPVLYEVVSRFFVKLRDLQNQQMKATGQPFQPWETWQMQAPGWVYERIRKDPKKASEYDDYHQVFPRLIKELEEAGVPVPNGKVTMETLMDPRTPNAMSRTRAHYQQVPTGTVEVASKLTPAGYRAYNAVRGVRALAEQGVPWARNAVAEYEKIQRRAFKALGTRYEKQPSLISKLFSVVTGRDMDVSRIDFDGYGTFEGTLSPNIRIPMTGATDKERVVLSEAERRVVLAAIGTEWNQAAMAASHFGQNAAPDAEPDTFTVFLQGYTKGIPTDQVLEFSNKIGFPVNATQHPNGYAIDINVGGMEGRKPTREQVARFISETFGEGANVEVFKRSYSSDYIDSGEYEGILHAHNISRLGRGKEKDAGTGDTAGKHSDLLSVREALRAIAKQRDTEFDTLADTIRRGEESHAAAQRRAEQKQLLAEAKEERRREKEQAAIPATAPPAGPAELYSLPAVQPARPPRMSDQILDLAKQMRASTPVDTSQHDPADVAMAQRFAGDQRFDLEKLAKIDPDEYLNFGKLDMDERPKEHLRNMVRLAAEAGGWNPKQTVGFDVIRREAAKLLGGDSVLDVKKLKDKETLNPAVRLAYGITLKNTEAEVIKRTQELAKSHESMTPDQRLQAQREIDVLDKHMRQLMNTLIPARSQDGRNLVYHRIMAQGSFDREYWNARVKRLLNLPPQAELPDNVHKPLNDAITNGQLAEKEYNDAKQAEKDADASGDATAKTKAKERVSKAGDGLKDARKKVAGAAAVEEMTTLEGLMSLWRAGLLTSPPARGADILSNASFHALEKLANMPATWIDAAMAKRTGREAVRSQWSSRQRKAVWQGAAEGMKSAQKKLGEVRSGNITPEQNLSGKIETYRQFNMGTGKLARGAKRYHDSVFALLQATDMPFREAGYRMGLAEFSELQAINEHKAGKLPQGMTMAQRADQLMKNPTEEIETEARAMGDFMTFAQNNPISDAIGRAKRGGRGSPGADKARAALNFLIPFDKVPTNVLARVLEYSGLTGAVKTPKVAWQLANRTLSQKDQRQYANLMGRGLVGAGLQFLGYALARAGAATGLRDDNDREGRLADEASGRPPGAIRVGNQWLQISRLAPFGNAIISGASMFQNMHKVRNPSDLMAAAGGTALKSVAEMPFLQGIDMVREAIGDPGDKTRSYISRSLGSVIPAGIAKLAAQVDPAMRDLHDEGVASKLFASDLVSRVPGASYSLNERRDVLGRAMRQPWAPLADPFSTRRGHDDPVSQAIARDQVPMGRLDRSGEEPKDIYRKRAELAGEMTYRAIMEALQSPEYQMAETAEDRREVLKDARAAANRALGKMTTRDAQYKESDEDEKRRMIDQYLEEVRSLAPLQ